MDALQRRIAVGLPGAAQSQPLARFRIGGAQAFDIDLSGLRSTAGNQSEQQYQAGRVARVADRNVELSAREIGLLEILIQRAGRLVSKEQIVDHLCEWGEEVSNNAIEVYIHRLRKKIEKGPIRIATVRGLGYCLEKIPG